MINEDVMDLQSPLVNCSTSSTATEGNRNEKFMDFHDLVAINLTAYINTEFLQ